jgi:hypothetical protein
MNPLVLAAISFLVLGTLLRLLLIGLGSVVRLLFVGFAALVLAGVRPFTRSRPSPSPGATPACVH